MALDDAPLVMKWAVFGISVAAPIAQVPASVAALKALATPNVKTGVLDENPCRSWC